MKLSIFLSVAALAIAGAAVAQVTIYGEERQGIVPKQAFGPPPVQELGAHWTNPELWDGYADGGATVDGRGPVLPTVMERQVAAGLKTAVPQMRLACAADQQSLCGDKAGNLAVDRCLEYHRQKLSRPCKSAWDKVTMAAEGRL
ncbi:MAG: hypothetical protein JSR98_10000 [Proteobacteria bacterium]|nr:hypothetical protein [Pseudomonadota bacterium]